MPTFSQPPRNSYRLAQGLPKSRTPPCPSHPLVGRGGGRQLPAERGRAPGGFLTVWHHLLGLPGTRSGLRERRCPGTGALGPRRLLRLCPCWLRRGAGDPKITGSFRLERTDKGPRAQPPTQRRRAHR